MGDSSRADEIRYELAGNWARGLLTLTHQRPPVDVQAIIDLAGIPVVERALPDGTRATIGDIAGRRSMILNRRWRFSSESERRWVLAEELGHVLMGHKLVESTEPGRPTISLLEQRSTKGRRARSRRSCSCRSPRCGGAGSASPRRA